MEKRKNREEDRGGQGGAKAQFNFERLYVVTLPLHPLKTL
jgi:hypothetical protein